MSDAIIVTVDSVRTRASTQEALLTLAIPLEKAALIAKFLGMIEKQVAVAFAEIGEEKQQDNVPKEETKLFGKYATELYRLGWFYNPVVLSNIGSDEEFLTWVEQQPCCIPESPHLHEGDIVAAHVRRIADGAGIGIKPAYSAIPLCNRHHQIQHNQGEVAIGGKGWCDKQRQNFLKEWASSTLAKKLDYSSMGMVPTDELLTWARKHNLEGTLPSCYRES